MLTTTDSRMIARIIEDGATALRADRSTAPVMERCDAYLTRALGRAPLASEIGAMAWLVSL